MKKVGLFGGTFDPLHIGHMVVAECVREACSLDEIWFIPSSIPPHKSEASVESEDRYRMVEESIEENEHFEVMDVELKREGKSFTLDTILTLKRRYPDVVFSFIVGGDMAESLEDWHRIDELMEEVTFIGVKRPGYEFDSHRKLEEVEIPLLAISSTEIRDRLHRGETVRYMVPEAVYAYIKRKGLYGSE